MMNDLPKTKEEAFAQLDAMLSEEDKKALMEEDDLFDYHFSLGMWIRNNWIYPLSDEELRAFSKIFSDEESQIGFFFIHPDRMSSVIIEKYVEYLINKNREHEKNRQ